MYASFYPLTEAQSRESGALMKAVFLDYDTVSNGDLDTSALSAAVGDLVLCTSDDERPPSAFATWTSYCEQGELSRELLRGAPKLG